MMLEKGFHLKHGISKCDYRVACCKRDRLCLGLAVFGFRIAEGVEQKNLLFLIERT